MIITHDGDPATPEGISHIDAIRHAAQEAVKGTPWPAPRSSSPAPRPPTRTFTTAPSTTSGMIAGIAALSLISGDDASSPGAWSPRW